MDQNGAAPFDTASVPSTPDGRATDAGGQPAGSDPATGPVPTATRLRQAVIAGHQGDVTTARCHLTDREPTVRAAALGALHRAGALTAADLRGAMIDTEPGVRRRGAELVAALVGEGPASTVSLLALLDDPDATVVEVTAWACGEREVPEPTSVERLAGLARTAEDALVREAAVAALGAIGDPAGRDAVLAATGDKATVRRRAVLALAAFDGADVEAALTRALTDRDWQVRQAAEDLGATEAPGGHDRDDGPEPR